MAKKKRQDEPESAPPDPIQAALDAVEKATGEKLSDDSSETDREDGPADKDATSSAP